ncbi:hypothetical protein [Adhaeribacter arboris]|uniref:hypothetical protein n=1 Tax=Adhaeribacter arboris TaxID=2072846 RepID=UPI0013048A48|nr:hypothetical protein [Adhaeribacter arboris]
MVTIIKRGTDKQEIEKILANLESTKKFDAYKYCGVVKLDKDALDIQKIMRDEWK